MSCRRGPLPALDPGVCPTINANVKFRIRAADTYTTSADIADIELIALGPKLEAAAAHEKNVEQTSTIDGGAWAPAPPEGVSGAVAAKTRERRLAREVQSARCLCRHGNSFYLHRLSQKSFRTSSQLRRSVMLADGGKDRPHELFFALARVVRC